MCGGLPNIRFDTDAHVVVFVVGRLPVVAVVHDWLPVIVRVVVILFADPLLRVLRRCSHMWLVAVVVVVIVPDVVVILFVSSPPMGLYARVLCVLAILVRLSVHVGFCTVPILWNYQGAWFLMGVRQL